MYEQFNLRSNPFLEDFHEDFPMIDREEVSRDLDFFLNGFMKQASPQMLAILGDYGIGKTFVLLQLLKKLKEGKILGDFKTLSLYMKVLTPKPPTKYFHYLYSETMNRLGLSSLRLLSKEIRGLRNKPRLARLQEIDQDLVKALSCIGTDLESPAWSFLRGAPILASQMKKINVDSKITTDERAEFIYIEFLKTLDILGYKSLILLIDEFEYILTATGAKRSAQIIVSFKDLFDKTNEMIGVGENICKPVFIIACTPGVWREGIPSLMNSVGLGGIYPFWERIYSTYTLKPFSDDETRRLVTSRLQARRIKTTNDAISPFTHDFFPFITKVTQGIPRRTLRRTAFVLDIADQRGIERINRDEAENILKEFNLIKTNKE